MIFWQTIRHCCSFSRILFGGSE